MEGFYGFNRRNWSDQTLPGTHIADTADLDGNYVLDGTRTASIAAMTFGGGIYDLTSGKMTIGAILDAAKIRTRLSGWIVLPATAQPLDIAASSGLTQIIGAVTNLDLEVGGHAAVLLGPNATIPSGERLRLSGQRHRTGWDGSGSATLTVAGTLEFAAGMQLTITGYALNPYLVAGDRIVTPNFSATIAAYEEINSGSTNRLWLTDVVGMPVVGEVFDCPRGKHNFAVLEPRKATVASIASRGVAPLQRFRSGAVGGGLTETTVTATINLAEGSNVVATGFGPGTHELGGGAGTGVTYVDQGATLPAGVTLTAGKLVLTV